MTPIVVKVGGSLFDIPHLGKRLASWLETLPTREVVLVPGGGQFADVVPTLDRVHNLGERGCHWLALFSLSFSARFLAMLFPLAAVVKELANFPEHWRHNSVTIVDPYTFALLDEGRPGSLPHCGDVTSDSVAARVAEVMHARELILLKSVTLPDGVAWTQAHKQGVVDAYFAKAVSKSVPVRVVNFRHWSR